MLFINHTYTRYGKRTLLTVYIMSMNCMCMVYCENLDICQQIFTYEVSITKQKRHPPPASSR